MGKKKSLKEYLEETVVTWTAPSGLEFKLRRLRNPLKFARLVTKHKVMKTDWQKFQGVTLEDLMMREGLLDEQIEAIDKIDLVFKDLFPKMVLSPKIVVEGESDPEKGILAIDDIEYADKFALFYQIIGTLAGEEKEELFREPTGTVGTDAVAGGEGGSDG